MRSRALAGYQSKGIFRQADEAEAPMHLSSWRCIICVKRVIARDRLVVSESRSSAILGPRHNLSIVLMR
jgi:hypothetical protein